MPIGHDARDLLPLSSLLCSRSCSNLSQFYSCPCHPASFCLCKKSFEGLEGNGEEMMMEFQPFLDNDCDYTDL
ncbi:hypothetical protein RIF29_19573 [Crotalaria pallida]|uniref:Uncharacterized protein n=1 Tax=Crotalaria pallida TaxID=3830 RepID=A0AAN9EZP1_CROPI